MRRKYYELLKNTQVGCLYKEFYTDKNKIKKIRYIGYILLGIFSGVPYGLDISLYELPPEKNKLNKHTFIIKSGRKNIGFFIKEEFSVKDKKYHELKGKITLGHVDIKIKALPFRLKHDHNKNEQHKIPDYIIELNDTLKISVVRLVDVWDEV